MMTQVKFHSYRADIDEETGVLDLRLHFRPII
jgi:hypothetical protein